MLRRMLATMLVGCMVGLVFGGFSGSGWSHEVNATVGTGTEVSDANSRFVLQRGEACISAEVLTLERMRYAAEARSSDDPTAAYWRLRGMQAQALDCLLKVIAATPQGQATLARIGNVELREMILNDVQEQDGPAFVFIGEPVTGGVTGDGLEAAGPIDRGTIQALQVLGGTYAAIAAALGMAMAMGIISASQANKIAAAVFAGLAVTVNLAGQIGNVINGLIENAQQEQRQEREFQGR
jgi:hypothetical protein